MQNELQKLRRKNERQYNALVTINDEVMSILHAYALRQETIAADTVIDWMHDIYDLVQRGLDKPAHFMDKNKS